MNFSGFIARRYLFSRTISGVIHVISLISLIGVSVGSFALIVVLSVFNGFENVVLSLYNSFDSDLKITPIEGKYFTPSIDSLTVKLPPEAFSGYKGGDSLLSYLKGLPEVTSATFVIEENAMLQYNKNQTIATLKAISPEYLFSMGVDSMVFLGKPTLTKGKTSTALIGAGVAGRLDLNIYDEIVPVQVFLPKKGNYNVILAPQNAFNRRSINAAGIFSIQQEFDEKFMLLPLDFIRPMVGEDQRITGIEINVLSEDAIDDLKEKLREMFGKSFEVKDRYEQHAWLYKIMKSEKLAVYLILSFILLIAAFNLIGALLMLAIEKKKDMAVLKSMGAGENKLRNIFFYEGLLLSSIGAILGIGLGTFVCWLQMKYHLIKIKPGSTFVLDAYPVAFKADDFILVFVTVVILGLIASYYPARTAYKQLSIQDLHK